jgi:hypothetical protein
MADANTRILAQTVYLTIEDLADLIVHLDSEQQALLISRIAALATFSTPSQLQSVTDDPALTSSGRNLMEWIGAYAPKQPRRIDPASLANCIKIACETTRIHSGAVAALLELASRLENQVIASAQLVCIARELERYP